MGTPKRLKRKVGEGSSGVVAELGRQVTVADSSQDHDTNVALVCAILLPNDVIALNEEASYMIRDLLVIQQVQVRVVTLVCFKLHFRYLMIFVFAPQSL